MTPSNSLCKTFISEPEYSFAINNFHSLQAGINFTVIKAIATEFKKEAEVIRKAAFIGYNYQNKKLKDRKSVV